VPTDAERRGADSPADEPAPGPRPCPACGAPTGSARAATASEPELRATGQSFALAPCPRCGSALTLGSAPDALAVHEGAYYAPTRGIGERLVEPLRRLAYADLLRHFRELPAGAHLLEVGCGDGRLLAALAARGLVVTGIEPSPSAADRARRRGVEVIAADLDQAAARLEDLPPFDALVFWHSLEHFDDPAAALATASARLRPGGRLVVAVPNRASWQARLGGDLWFHQDVPRHRVHLSAVGLRLLLERSGFAVEGVSHLLVEQNPLGMWQTMLNRLGGERDELFRTLKRDPSLGSSRPRRVGVVALALLLALPAALAELCAGAAGAGGTVVAVAARGDLP
jgi:SAM-dependent methyltransferase